MPVTAPSVQQKLASHDNPGKALRGLPGQRLGKGMLIAVWLGVMALLTLYFSNVEEDRNNPNREFASASSEGYREITLKRNSRGHYIANGEINGEPVTFLLDTGATLVAVPYHLMDRLGLEKGMAVPTQTANGVSTSYMTTVEWLKLGDIEMENVRAGLAAGLKGNEILLGMSFLSHLELIQRGDSLIIRQYH